MYFYFIYTAAIYNWGRVRCWGVLSVLPNSLFSLPYQDF
jgi:hypothetical protein